MRISDIDPATVHCVKAGTVGRTVTANKSVTEARCLSAAELADVRTAIDSGTVLDLPRKTAEVLMNSLRQTPNGGKLADKLWRLLPSLSDI